MNCLITGATGNIGDRVVRRLLEAEIRPRILTRNARKARRVHGARVDICVGDLADPSSLRRAFTDVSAILLVSSGPELAERDTSAARVAQECGVEYVVKLSSLDVEQQVGTGVWHGRGEDAIRASGLQFTFVRPSGFMSNVLSWAPSIKAQGIVCTSTGDGRIAMIHPDDIADVITEALLQRKYDGQTLPISGPEALTYAEMTATLGTALGRELTFLSVSDSEALEMLAGGEPPDAMAIAIADIWRAVREGRLATVTETVRRVLGRAPRSFETWANENAAKFRR